MGKVTRSLSAGYTIVEFIVVIAVIGILAALAFTGITNSQARARDAERVADMNTLHSRLEEYHNDKGGYPNTFTATTFAGIDPEALKDPNGNSITISSTVSDQAAARAVASPTGSGAQYIYIPYPTGCTAITCTGYVLKSYIEQPNGDIPNPYARYGLNNN
ncbi:MAG: type II secretion system protein [Candidatus Saccharimonadales bacterium]